MRRRTEGRETQFEKERKWNRRTRRRSNIYTLIISL